MEKMYENCEKLLAKHQMQLSELEEHCSELTNINKCLKNDKELLERQLADALHLAHGQSELNHYADIGSDINETEISIPPLNLTGGLLHTPCNKQSLCREITTAFMEEPLLPSPLCEKELEDVMVLLHPPFISKSVAKQLSGARTLKFDMITTDCETTDEEAIATNNGSAGLTDKQLSPEEGFDRPAVIRALLYNDFKSMIQMLRAGNWLAYEQFVRRFIDEVVSVVISRNELDRRSLIQSTMVRRLKEFQESEARKYNEALKKTCADFSHLQRSIASRLIPTKQNETADVSCGPSVEGICAAFARAIPVQHLEWSSYLPFSKFVHPAWSRDMVNIGMAVFMAGAIMFCLLVGLNDTETPLTFRHLSPPPL